MEGLPTGVVNVHEVFMEDVTVHFYVVFKVVGSVFGSESRENYEIVRVFDFVVVNQAITRKVVNLVVRMDAKIIAKKGVVISYVLVIIDENFRKMVRKKVVSGILLIPKRDFEQVLN